MLSEPLPLFARQAGPHQGGLAQQENQQGFSAHQLQQQQPHQQQFAYHVKQQQTSYQQHVQHGNQKQALLPTPSPQTQPRSGSAQHNQGAQSGYSVALPPDQVHPQPYHGSNVHPTQQSYQVHSHPQGYQGKQTLPYQLHQMPSGGQHPYHPQPQQQLPLPTQYPVSQGHPAPQALQGPQEPLPRQQVLASHQYHQQQGASQGEGRQSQYDTTHSNQQARVPHHQQQQQHQKQCFQTIVYSSLCSSAQTNQTIDTRQKPSSTSPVNSELHTVHVVHVKMCNPYRLFLTAELLFDLKSS
ncbi:PREDICTED: putative mediator of RNA polymerase II transcription subunit 26 [Acropora digitifera]|uniref:putative mediator of RNA polymerase II transcription subunit 26 n=1 Tax=Acropora digitifera TaxID=70779 RepID=UPI00077A9FBA|nr:PREDICTED: putative mediator of RNA polymerase II transcription subunit 26 [Acropora digitifera]